MKFISWRTTKALLPQLSLLLAMFAGLVMALYSVVLGFDTLTYRRMNVDYRNAVMQILQPDQELKITQIEGIFRYLSPNTQQSLQTFFAEGDSDFAMNLARMSILVDYRNKFIGLPEWLEDRLGLSYGYTSSPAPLFRWSLFILGYHSVFVAACTWAFRRIRPLKRPPV